MNEPLAILLDSSVTEGGSNLVLGLLISVVGGLFLVIGYFLKRDISDMYSRHRRAEDKFDKVDDRLGDHDSRLVKVETKVEERAHRRGD